MCVFKTQKQAVQKKSDFEQNPFLKCFKNIGSVCALFADSFQTLETCETF